MDVDVIFCHRLDSATSIKESMRAWHASTNDRSSNGAQARLRHHWNVNQFIINQPQYDIFEEMANGE
ncbi:hypothetical protein PI124_g12518 [Phytophthora idaei]|nr:hypothetical protein PI124_g12518 [Phytophthora idaei]